MKRWEPIKTEKKQLGGIIKLLKKVSPKLASKAKGRLLVSRLRQVKDLKTPYIFPGQLGWSPAETRTVWHRTNNPNFKVKRVFEGRWDAKEHGAPKNGLWVSEKKDIGFMNDRPILIQLQQILKKPMVQIGDIPAQGKNKLRNHILREAEQSGADQLEIDPKRYKESVDFVAQNRNISTQDAKDLIDNWILYLKDPGEVRARGLASVAYSRTMHTKDIPKEVDGGQGIFTKESLDNLYRNIFSIGAPIGVGLYATQN